VAMNPQVLIDGVAHGTHGSILLLDNRRMGAISALQEAQYGAAYATRDEVVVDYVRWARAVQGVAPSMAAGQLQRSGLLRIKPAPMTAFPSSTCRSTMARIHLVASAPMAAGTSAIGSKPRRRCEMRSDYET